MTGRSGALGEVQYITVPFWPLNTTLWVKDFKGNDAKYVYRLKLVDLKRFNSGAGVPTLNRNDLDLLPVLVHSTMEQRKIAEILSAYNDLIENNARRIAILEQMVRSLYQEWFVRFRFPGHKKVPLIESSIGPIPEGWVVSTLGEQAVNFDSKRRPLSSMQRSDKKGSYPYYGAAKVFDYVNDFIF